MREVKRDKPKAVPTQLLITIGGFAGPRHEVRLQRGRLQYCTNDGQETVTPSADAWDTFWAELDRINVWAWRPRYDTRILDGEQWTAEIRHEARSVRSFGSNRYPRRFQEFLQAVRALTGRPFSGGG